MTTYPTNPTPDTVDRMAKTRGARHVIHGTCRSSIPGADAIRFRVYCGPIKGDAQIKAEFRKSKVSFDDVIEYTVFSI